MTTTTRRGSVAAVAAVLGGVVLAVAVAACVEPYGRARDSADAGRDEEELEDGGVAVAVEAGKEIETATGVTIAPTELTLTLACGASAGADVLLTNDGTETQSFELRLDAAAGFSLDGATDGTLRGELAPGTRRSVKVLAQGLTAGDASADIRVKIGKEERSVGVRAKVTGAQVAITAVDFGLVRQNVVSEPVKVAFTNSGNAAATIVGFTGDATDFDLPSNILVPPNGSVDATVKMKAGPAGSEIKASLVATGSGLCAPSTLELRGRRVSDAILLSGGLNFGVVGCNASAPPAQKVTISNFTVQDAVYSALLPANSRFTIGAGATGSVPKGDGVNAAGKAEIDVVPKAPGQAFGSYSEELTVTVNGKTSTVPVQMAVQGALIEAASTEVEIDDGQQKSFQIVNKGNAAISICYRATANTPAAWSIEADDTFAANSTGDLDVFFDGNNSGTYLARVELVKCPGDTVPVCQASLPVINLRGYGRSVFGF